MTDGLLLVDKPVGPTSHDIVQRVRRALGVRRVGHTGTLDPPASGLLPVLVGRATRLARFVPDGPKRYIGALRLGVTSLTDDDTSAPRTRFEGPLPSAPVVEERAGELEGQYLQTPPAISARHVGGRRLYRLNRVAPVVEGPSREVTVSRFRVRASTERDTFDFEAIVSAGTYVRSLVRDLGARLGCGAILVALRRTTIGPFRVEDAVSPPGSDSALLGAWIPLDQIPLQVDDYRIDRTEDERRFLSGVPIAASDDRPLGLRSVSFGGRRLGIGLLAESRLRPVVVLAAPDAALDSTG